MGKLVTAASAVVWTHTVIFDFEDIQNAMDKSVSDKNNIVKAVVRISKDC